MPIQPINRVTVPTDKPPEPATAPAPTAGPDGLSRLVSLLQNPPQYLVAAVNTMTHFAAGWQAQATAQRQQVVEAPSRRGPITLAEYGQLPAAPVTTPIVEVDSQMPIEQTAPTVEIISIERVEEMLDRLLAETEALPEATTLKTLRALIDEYRPAIVVRIHQELNDGDGG